VPFDYHARKKRVDMRSLMFVCGRSFGRALRRRILGDRLENVSEAKTIRVRKGQLLVTDGPFAETTEWIGEIGGFDLLDCASIDEAIEIASQHPMARFGKIEVRPLRARD